MYNILEKKFMTVLCTAQMNFWFKLLNFKLDPDAPTSGITTHLKDIYTKMKEVNVRMKIFCQQHLLSLHAPGVSASIAPLTNTPSTFLLQHSSPDEDYDINVFLTEIEQPKWANALYLYAIMSHKCWSFGTTYGDLPSSFAVHYSCFPNLSNQHPPPFPTTGQKNSSFIIHLLFQTKILFELISCHWERTLSAILPFLTLELPMVSQVLNPFYIIFVLFCFLSLFLKLSQQDIAMQLSQLYLQTQEKFKLDLLAKQGSIMLMQDAWNAPNFMALMAVMTHFIEIQFWMIELMIEIPHFQGFSFFPFLSNYFPKGQN
ncbi:hypothetical protein VP01_4063g3 [Puccinia sorghi]|uniref:Uncharacterized protein n=1 Tax=Puccinia sorghi TaxID=27349 RepID=A0A0L6USD6_9BASI|nr:hypothetical protein VP01_4063g3 [Puccinia sorghi]